MGYKKFLWVLDIFRGEFKFFIWVVYREKMAKRCSRRRSLRNNRRTRGGGEVFRWGMGGGESGRGCGAWLWPQKDDANS